MRGGALRQTDRAVRRPISKRSVGPPRRGRVHRQEGTTETARGGIGCKPVSPRSGAPKARLAAKEETRQAARALLASVNAPGPRVAVGKAVLDALAINSVALVWARWNRTDSFYFTRCRPDGARRVHGLS